MARNSHLVRRKNDVEKSPAEVLTDMQALNGDDSEYSGSELLQDVQILDQSPPNLCHDSALMLPQHARFPENSTQQIEYFHHDSTLVLPQSVTYPGNLTQQSEYVHHDSLMPSHPTVLSPFLAELDRFDIDINTPTTAYARTFTNM